MAVGDRPLDEEQEEKYQEMVDLLLVGGYFRARIAGLSRFDKIVGGMAWCITSSNEDLDIDLLFQEEASLKQRIKIGEDIIKALQRMKCPFRLESHQIQGGANTSDFVKIFPVVQWLVKRVIETREETGDLTRIYSESQFSKNYSLPEEAVIEEKKDDAASFLTRVGDRYKHNRKFRKGGRRIDYFRPKTREEAVQLALLEFGDYYKVNKKETKEKSAAAQELENQLGKKGGEKNNEEDEETRKAELRKEMTLVNLHGKINSEVLGGLMPDNIDELESMYSSMDQFSEENQKLFGAKIHQQNVLKLEREIQQQEDQNQKLKEKLGQTQQVLEETQAEYTKKHEYNQRIIFESKKLDELETPENTAVLQKLKGLVALNENLRNQENLFKGNCKRQREEILQQIAELKEQVSQERLNSEEAEIEAVFEKDKQKLQDFRSLLAKKTRNLVLVERKVDEVPSRIELAQYQRMFVELYDQIASKLVETRQYFNTYNMLEDTKTYLSKEVSILNSIHDNYKTVVNNKNGKEQLLSQIAEITKSVALTFSKTETRLNNEKENKNKMNDSLTSLLEKERAYFKTTKEFLEECKKNELLQSQQQD